MAQKIKTLVLTAIAGAAMAISASASAITLTNSAGSFADWGGFDWAENGSAVVDGFDATVLTGGSDTFDLTYFADAVSISEAGGGSIGVATIGLFAGDYEYTIVATLNETSTCTVDNGSICTTADFALNSGSFEIYYDVADNADLVAGTGLDDGILLIAGTLVAGGSGGFDIITGGNSVLNAVITFTNSTFISPDLIDSVAATTLQIGDNTTNWTAPTGTPDGSGTADVLPADALLLQADGNQTFTAARVPEPGVLALLGVAMLGMAATRRRKSVK
jgi:hypothetical protein